MEWYSAAQPCGSEISWPPKPAETKSSFTAAVTFHFHEMKSHCWCKQDISMPPMSMEGRARHGCHFHYLSHGKTWGKHSSKCKAVLQIPPWLVAGCLTLLSQLCCAMSWCVSPEASLFKWLPKRSLSHRQFWGQRLYISNRSGQARLVPLYFPQLSLWRERRREKNVAFPCHLSC